RPRTRMGKAAVAGDEWETVGIVRPTSDQNPASHRGNDDGMSVHGDPTQHGKPQAVRARDPQPDAREGQAGPPGVAERPVVPLTPGNSGRGKGPWFKANARSDRQPGDWHAPTTSSEGWEVADGVAHQSEELAGLPVLRPVRQGVSPRHLGVGLCPLPEKWWRARGRRPKLRRHREVGTRPVAGRIGGRTPKWNVSAPAGPARVHPQRGWQAKAAGHPLHQGPCGADGYDVSLGADLRGRLGAGTTRLSPGTQRLGRRSPSRAA